MLEIKDLNVTYKDGRKALKDLCLNIDDGECVGLIGANGAGKSTLFKAITGLVPFEGSIKADGETELLKIREKVGYVIQESDDQMFMPTVMDDMIFGLTNSGMSREKAVEVSLKVLEDLGIGDLRDRHNHRISGGEKKMAAIAVILAMSPSVILFDEPSSSLDPKNRRRVLNVLRSLNCTRIIASHDLDLILDTCDRVIVIKEGEIKADSKADIILKDKALLEENDLELPISLQKNP